MPRSKWISINSCCEFRQTGSCLPLPPTSSEVWVLLPDGGTPLSDRLDETGLTDALVAVLPQYGQLQRDLIPHVEFARAPLESFASLLTDSWIALAELS